VGLQINKRGFLYCLPAVAAYIGSDIVAGVLTTGIYTKEKLSIFVDKYRKRKSGHYWLCPPGPCKDNRQDNLAWQNIWCPKGISWFFKIGKTTGDKDNRTLSLHTTHTTNPAKLSCGV